MSRLRLVVYDRTCRGGTGRPGLSHAWAAGSRLFAGLRRFDAYRGVDSWDEALSWLAAVAPSGPIAEVQFWGHGRWGCALVNGVPFDALAFRAGHPLNARLSDVRARLQADSLWWFRTCETFGTDSGQRFARACADFFGCRVAGHTYVIGTLQSGLHVLGPGQTPAWPRNEGVVAGQNAGAPSRWSEPNTITCASMTLPRAFV